MFKCWLPEACTFAAELCMLSVLERRAFCLHFIWCQAFDIQRVMAGVKSMAEAKA